MTEAPCRTECLFRNLIVLIYAKTDDTEIFRPYDSKGIEKQTSTTGVSDGGDNELRLSSHFKWRDGISMTEDTIFVAPLVIASLLPPFKLDTARTTTVVRSALYCSHSAEQLQDEGS